MGRKFYTSGASASDLAKDRPDSARAVDLSLIARIPAPQLDEAGRQRASENVRRLCPEDADVMLEALGLSELPAVNGMPRCPTCGVPRGSGCVSQKGHRTSQPHIARRRLAGRIDNTEGDRP